jgi:hypothetical protein
MCTERDNKARKDKENFDSHPTNLVVKFRAGKANGLPTPGRASEKALK